MAKLEDVVASKSLFLLDVEGVLLNNIDQAEPLPHAQDLIKQLRELNKRILVLTDVARKSRRYVHKRLVSAGLYVKLEEVFNAGYATAQYVKSQKPDARCFVISEEGLIEEFYEADLEIVFDDTADFVVVGVDRGLTYAELNHATRLVLKGAKFVCAGGSKTYTGAYLGDSGVYLGEYAIAMAISTATGKEPVIVGKPFGYLFKQALEYAGASPEEAVLVGDSLAKDVAGAKPVGICSILVAQQSPKPSELWKHPKPDFVIRDLGELCKALSKLG